MSPTGSGPGSAERSGRSNDVVPPGATIVQTTKPRPDETCMTDRSAGPVAPANSTRVPDQTPEPGCPSTGTPRKPPRDTGVFAFVVRTRVTTLAGSWASGPVLATPPRTY